MNAWSKVVPMFLSCWMAVVFAATARQVPFPPEGSLLLREISYSGTLTENEARFVADIQLESRGRAESSLVLFEGDVAVLTTKLPPGLRLVREGNQYRLIASGDRKQRFKLEFVVKINRAEPWNQISFVGPTAAIASVEAQAGGPGIELQLLSGTLESKEQKDGATRLRGFLGPDRTVSLRWQSKAAEAARKAVVTCETAATAFLTPTVIKFTTHLKYEIVQGQVAQLRVALPAGQVLTKLQGTQIRDWQVKTDGDQQRLEIEFIKPVEKSYALTLFSEQTIESAPLALQLAPPQPLDLARETGSFTVSAEDVQIDTENIAGLRQINAPAGTLAAYQFYGRPFTLGLNLRRIEPTLTVFDRVTVRLEDARLVVRHALNLSVEKAGIYSVKLGPFEGFVVSDVRGDGIEDWKSAGGQLTVQFGSRVLGQRKIEVELEQPLKAFPDRVEVAPLRIAGANRETAQVGAASTAGIRLKTGELRGLREIPITSLSARADELLAFSSEQADWKLQLSAERLSSRIVADIFNLVTIGDGIIGGSAAVRCAIHNQGVQEFRLRIPDHWKNVEFTGPNIRRKEQNADIWTVQLQEKAWGVYTLVVTYDAQFDPHKATLPVGGIHVLDAERETGSIAVTSAGNLEIRETRDALRVTRSSDGGTNNAPRITHNSLRRIDEFELPEADRALITRPVLLAWRYERPDYTLALDVKRFEQLSVLDAVADRTQLTSVLTDAGQMLTQASFMVKNNEKQFQHFRMPKGAEFWSCFVAGKAVKPERDGETLLVPLPRGEDRDKAFPVDIVYAFNLGTLKTVWPRNLTLAAPVTDMQTTFAEWELYVPQTHRLAGFGGNMTVARGTTYGLHDAWQKFVLFFQHYLSNEETVGSLLTTGGFVLLGSVFVAMAIRLRHVTWACAFGVMIALCILGGIVWLLLTTYRHSFPAIEAGVVDGDASMHPNEVSTAYLFVPEPPAPPASGMVTRNFAIPKSPSLQIDGREGIGRAGEAAAPVPKDMQAYLQQRGVPFPDGSKVTVNRAAGVMTVRNTPEHVELAEEILTQGVAAEKPVAGDLSIAATAGGGIQGVTGPAPRIAGIRPIRIDIPRMGTRFSFTKVLNVRDEPLSVRARAMETKVFNAVQHGAQFIAFAIGAGLLWWQLRRTKPSSLLMTVALALLIVSVGHWLISIRKLHFALIAIVPLLCAAVAAGLLARYWPKRHPREETEHTHGGHHAGESGLPPAIAAIALTLFVAGQSAVAAVGDHGQSATAPAEAPSPRAATVIPSATDISILSAKYTGNVRERVGEFDAEITAVSARRDAEVMLFGEEVAVQEFSASPNVVTLVRDGKTLRAKFSRAGRTTLKLKFLVKLGGDVTSRHVLFAVPHALSSRVEAILDEPEAAVEFPTAVSFQTRSEKQQTRVTAVVGAGERVELRWTPRVKRAAETAATVFCQNTTLLTLANGVINTRAILDYQVTQGELRQLRVRLPVGQRLLRVEGDSIRTWEVKDESAGQLLLVELLKGVTGSNYVLHVVTEKVIDALPAKIEVQIPSALDVKRESGLVALSSGEELSLAVERVKELQRMDAEEFARVASVKRETIVSAYRFQKPGFELGVAVEAVQPQIEVVVRNHYQVGAEQLSIDAQVDYTIKRMGVFTLRFAVPAGFSVTSVHGEKVAQWHEKTDHDRRVLEVALKERTAGAYSLRLGLRKWQPQLPKIVAVSGVQPLDAQKLTGYVAVTSELGVQAKAESAEGLTEIPASALPAGTAQNATGVLAYKYLAAESLAVVPWKLNVAAELVEPWVRAEIVNWVTLTETRLSGRAVVRYEIQNAPVKEVRLRVPEQFQNVEINGDNIRRRDQEGAEWRVQLQNKAFGTYTLVVTWEQLRTATIEAAEFPGIEALGVERETGAVAVIAQAPLQVDPKTASADLIRTDPRELPEWAGRAPEATVLAYRYLRPGYQLACDVKRHEEAEVLQAIADNVRLVTVVADDGQMMTQLSLSIRNNARQYIEIALPKDAQVWSAFVAGNPVRPSLRGGKLLLPLERAGADEAPVTVDVVFVGATPFPKRAGTVALATPAIDVPLKNATWDLYLPTDYRISEFKGSMVREPNVSPRFETFSWSQYQQVEDLNYARSKSEMASSLGKVTENLRRGNVKQAAESYSRLKGGRKTDLYSYQGKENADKLEQDIRRAQASNVIAGNRFALKDELRQIDQPTQSRADEAEQKAAEQQWEKLQQSQELAAAKVQPLRVNLPTHGVRHTFKQVLQTESGKPMTVQFSAANTRAASWVMRIGLPLIGFAVMWLVVNAMVQHRRA